LYDHYISKARIWSWLLIGALPLVGTHCGGSSSGGDDDSTSAHGGGGSSGRAGAGGTGHGGTTAGHGSAGDKFTGGSGGKGGSSAGDAGSPAGTAGEAGSPAPGSGGAAGSGGGAGGLAGAGGNSGEGGGASGGPESGAGGEAACDVPQASCIGTLNNVGRGDFEIDFRLTSTSPDYSELLSQRDVCTHEYFWEIQLQYGYLRVETDDDNQHYMSCDGVTALNDGVSHWISVRRVNEEVKIYVDCKLDQTCASATDITMTLPNLEVGTGPCSGNSNISPFVGSLNDICIGTL
jgi:hypothetical protein